MFVHLSLTLASLVCCPGWETPCAEVVSEAACEELSDAVTQRYTELQIARLAPIASSAQPSALITVDIIVQDCIDITLEAGPNTPGGPHYLCISRQVDGPCAPGKGGKLVPLLWEQERGSHWLKPEVGAIYKVAPAFVPSAEFWGADFVTLAHPLICTGGDVQ